MNPRNVAIIQARMGSSRFPGKMLVALGGKPLLEWVVRRVSRAATLAQVILATSDRTGDDALADLATTLGIEVFRGSESDVLGRFAAAARFARADNVVRICADNPLIDPAEIDRLVGHYSKSACDYACNHQDRLGSAYADGFGAEILSAPLLAQIAETAVDARHREHVTLYLWDHAGEYRMTTPQAPADLAFPALRFDVDTPADLARLETLVQAGVSIETPAGDVVVRARQLDVFDEAATTCNEIDRYLKRLFLLCRSITGEPNRQTLRTLQELIPLTIHEVPSGTAVYDWSVPDEWTIRDAWIADSAGRRIVDFRASNLHVVSYSEPVNAFMHWADLEPRLHRHPLLAEAIPYRTSYYRRDWGFCVTQAQYDALARMEGPFRVVIDSQLKPGSLSYGEYRVSGQSPTEILISCYLCHPSMANDSLSGVLLVAFLARRIAALENRHWSYRIVFVPETIGAITYAAQHEDALKQIDIGLVVTTVGGPGKMGYKQSFDSSHPINGIIENTFTELGIDFITYPFDIHGSDERQYSSQGFRINTATICRDRYYEYPYYHSSLDDLSFVTAQQIEETLEVYAHLIHRLESRRVYRNRMPYCEVMLSKHDLYPATGGAQKPELGGRSELDLILWLLFLCDGKLDTDHIATRLGVPVDTLQAIADRLVAKGVLEVV